MSYGRQPIRVLEQLHNVGFPDLVRVAPERLQVQLPKGVLSISGTGLPALFRDFLCGNLTDITVGKKESGVEIVSVEITERFKRQQEPWHSGECCPVPGDLILVENGFQRDYLARSCLEFFGRFGRIPTDFVLGFTDRSYRICVEPDKLDAFRAAVFSSRLTPGSANTFTTLPSEAYFMDNSVFRYEASSIESTDHEPESWTTSRFDLSVMFAITRRGVGPTLPGLQQRSEDDSLRRASL